MVIKKRYKKYIALIFVGACVLALSFSAAAEETTDQEPEVLPPRSDETIEHDTSKEEREYDNLVGEDCNQDSPHILGVENNEENTDKNDATDTNSDNIEKSSFSLPIAIVVVGTIGVVLAVAYKKKKI